MGHSLFEMRQLLFFITFILSGFAYGNSALLYVGLDSERGWQIYSYDFQTKESEQLSSSYGDKRSPRYWESAKIIVCKDSLGRIVELKDGKTQPCISNLKSCSSYSLAPDGETVFYAIPEVEKRRQFIWKKKCQENGQEIVREIPNGMLKQVAVSSDGEKIAGTHIWQVNEERLWTTLLSKNTGVDYLTKEKTLASYPCWTPDSQSIVFSYKEDVSKTEDLVEVHVDSKELSILINTEEIQEINPSVDAKNKRIYFEQRTATGSSIAYYDRESKEVVPLQLPHQAKEPFWYETE